MMMKIWQICTVAAGPNHVWVSSIIHGDASMAACIYSNDNNVEDLEMLLEAYFKQLDGTHNKILSVLEYIDDAEDYVDIQLDSQWNELIQFQLVMATTSLAIAFDTLLVGMLAMNIPCQLYAPKYLPIFYPLVGGVSAGCFLMFLLMLVYARWKKLLGRGLFDE